MLLIKKSVFVFVYDVIISYFMVPCWHELFTYLHELIMKDFTLRVLITAGYQQGVMVYRQHKHHSFEAPYCENYNGKIVDVKTNCLFLYRLLKYIYFSSLWFYISNVQLARQICGAALHLDVVLTICWWENTSLKLRAWWAAHLPTPTYGSAPHRVDFSSSRSLDLARESCRL